MAKSTAPLALFLALNLLFFTIASANGESCPKDALKLGVCVNVLNLIKAKIGDPPVQSCCSVVEGLLDLQAAACLCTTIKANVLDIIKPNIPLDLSLLLNACGKKVPKGFQCA